MTILDFFFPARPQPALDENLARRRMIEGWMTTGIVPVAHIVADLGPIDAVTHEHEIVTPSAPPPLARRRRIALTTYSPGRA